MRCPIVTWRGVMKMHVLLWTCHHSQQPGRDLLSSVRAHSYSHYRTLRPTNTAASSGRLRSFVATGSAACQSQAQTVGRAVGPMLTGACGQGVWIAITLSGFGSGGAKGEALEQGADVCSVPADWGGE